MRFHYKTKPLIRDECLGRIKASQCQFRFAAINVKHGAVEQGDLQAQRVRKALGHCHCFVYPRPKRFARSFSKCDGGSVLAAAMSVATNMSCGSDAVAPKYFSCTSLGTLIRIFVLGALP
jgi:hypothetical protein